MSEWRSLDRVSLLVELNAETSLGAAEENLRAEGFTLGLENVADADLALPTGEWLARGAPGARDPWADPADHLVAGLNAQLADGRLLTIRPAPRRAVGPDLIALVVGMENRYARLRDVWLRVHRTDALRTEAHPLVAERNPPLLDDERRLLDAIADAVGAPPPRDPS